MWASCDLRSFSLVALSFEDRFFCVARTLRSALCAVAACPRRTVPRFAVFLKRSISAGRSPIRTIGACFGTARTALRQPSTSRSPRSGQHLESQRESQRDSKTLTAAVRLPTSSSADSTRASRDAASACICIYSCAFRERERERATAALAKCARTQKSPSSVVGGEGKQASKTRSRVRSVKCSLSARATRAVRTWRCGCDSALREA